MRRREEREKRERREREEGEGEAATQLPRITENTMEDVELNDDDLALLLTLEEDQEQNPTPTETGTETGSASARAPNLFTKARNGNQTTTNNINTSNINDDNNENEVFRARTKTTGGVSSSGSGFQTFNKVKRNADGYYYSGDFTKKKKKKATTVVERGKHEAEVISKIRVTKPVLGSLVLRERTNINPYTRLDQVNQVARMNVDHFTGPWSTLAVVVEKGFPKEGANGNKFLVLKIGDLEDTSFSLFLFGDAYGSHCVKVETGDVYLFSCAKAKVDEKNRSVSFSVANSDQLTRIGVAKDFGICKGTRRDGTLCSMAVNLQRSEYCKYHASHALKKLKAAKMNIRPQMGGSNFYAHQAKVIGQQEKARVDMMHRNRSKHVKALNSTELIQFTNMYSQAMPHSRGVGAIRAVADQSVVIPKLDNIAPSSMPPPPGSKKRMVDLTRSKGECTSQAFAKALQYVKSIGGLQAPDPNNTKIIGKVKRKVKGTTVEVLKKKKKAGHIKDNSKPDFLVEKENKRAEARRNFLSSFSSSRQQNKVEKSQKSLYHKEADQQDMTDATRRLNPMITKEQLTGQLESTHKMKVKCYFCRQCQQYYEFKPKCAGSHSVTRVEATKRFWECKQCKKRVTTFGVSYPKFSCSKCKSDNFEKVGMVKAPKGHMTNVASREQFKVRGEEHAKFLKSVR